MRNNNGFININPDLPLHIAKELIAIPSYKKGEMEERVIQYIGNRFKQNSLNYDIIHLSGNQIGIVSSIGKGKISLILHSHLDTVPPGNRKNWTYDPFTPFCKNGRLYGLGACDDKGSLSSMLATFESFIPIATKLNGKLIFMAVGGEERGGVGTKAVLKMGFKADAVILGEPTNLEPKIAHKGALRLKITVKGLSAHASTPRNGVNAISYMANLISKLDQLALTIEKENDCYTGNATMAITTIRGGTALNIIPDLCSISIDRRTLVGQIEDDLIHQVSQIIKEFELENPEINVEMKKIRFLKPALTELNEPIVKVAENSAMEVLGKRVSSTGFTASCDMTFLRNEGNMPVVILGPGDVNMAHKANEYIDIQSLYTASRIYGNIVIKWLS